VKEIVIEFIKILKIPLIIITLIFSWPDSLKLSEIIAYIDELKYYKDGSIMMKFRKKTEKVKKKVYKLEEQLKELGKQLKELKYNDKNVEKIIGGLGEIIIDLEALDNLNNYTNNLEKSSIIFPNSVWQVKLGKEDIYDIFGNDKIIENKVYRIKKPFKVFEYSQYFCLANPIKSIVKSGEIVKILKIEEKDRELYLVLKILN